jgi:hypothetical protein
MLPPSMALRRWLKASAALMMIITVAVASADSVRLSIADQAKALIGGA